jgi:hypothetical protein
MTDDRHPAGVGAGSGADDGTTRTDEYGDGAVEGTFLVTAADDASAVLRNVDTGQVHTLSSNPGLDQDDAVEGVVAPEPPMEVAFEVVEVHERRALTLRAVGEAPTTNAREVAADLAEGDMRRVERAGEGELHVIAVPDDEAATADAVADVLDDRETVLARAARLGVSRVRVRSEPGVVVVRYLP